MSEIDIAADFALDLDQVDVGEVGAAVAAGSTEIVPAPKRRPEDEGNTASGKQLHYIDSLKRGKEIDSPRVREALEKARQEWRENRFTKREASRLIDVLKDAPWKPREEILAQPANLYAGLYVNPDGRVIRVYLGQQSGQLLCKLVERKQRPFPLIREIRGGESTDGEPITVTYTEQLEYTYLGLARRFVKPDARRMTAEEAGELGKATGTCGDCGKDLDVPESVDRGIGPVCWVKNGHAG
jgi:hypothetical protein